MMITEILKSRNKCYLYWWYQFGRCKIYYEIDLNKTTCNDIAHIYYFLGIEVARAAINEYNSAYESGGSY